MKFLNLTLVSAALASAAVMLPAHAATLMVGISPLAACHDGAALVGARDVSIPTNRNSLASCTVALAGKITAADRTATLANRAVIETAMDNTDAALADFNAALDRNPQATNVYVNRGAALFKAGRFQEARSDFDHALRLNVADPAVVYFDRGMANERLGDNAAAYRDYKTAQNLNPGYTPATVELARFQVEQRYASN